MFQPIILGILSDSNIPTTGRKEITKNSLRIMVLLERISSLILVIILYC